MDIIFVVGIVITVITGFPVIMQLRQQPKGLHIIFFTEMWERFSYYGMRTILFVYMTQHFLFSDEAASGQYGAYTSLVYLLPLIGGMLADRYLGTTKAVAFGALLLVAGHLTMAIEQEPARNVLVYEGQRYDIASEGRQDKRQAWVVVDGQRYEFGPAETARAGMEIKGYAGLGRAAEHHSDRRSGDDSRRRLPDDRRGAAALLHERVLPRAVADHHGRRLPEGEPRHAGRPALHQGRSAPRWRVLALLLRDQPRRLLGAGGVRAGWARSSAGRAGFGAAGVGMLLGWLVFVRRRILFFTPGPAQLPAELGLPPNPELLKKPLIGPINREWLIYIVALLERRPRLAAGAARADREHGADASPRSRCWRSSSTT